MCAAPTLDRMRPKQLREIHMQRRAWPVARIAGTVFFCALIAYWWLDRSRFDNSSNADLLARAFGMAVACALIAAVVVTVRNSCTLRRRR